MIMRGLGILLSLNMEAVTFLLVAWFGGKKMNEMYPIEYSWINIFFIISLILIGYTWYVVLRGYIASENGRIRREEEKRKLEKNND